MAIGETAHGEIRDWWELIRPFSFSASVVPVCVGAAVAWAHGRGNPAAFAATLLGVLLIQAGTNALNEVFDVARGVDTLQTPRASRVVVTGRVGAGPAYGAGLGLLALGVGVGALISLTFRLGPVPFLVGLLGAALGYAYTGPPLHLKYRGLGLLVEAATMGPLMVLGAEYVQAGRWSGSGWAASLPVALLVAAILLGNDLRDLDTDRAAGIRTAAIVLGRRRAWRLYLALLAGAYACLVPIAATAALPWTALLALASLPLAVRAAAGGASALDRLDQTTARVHLVFGALLTVGIAVGGLRL